jgi:hypothetical protein
VNAGLSSNAGSRRVIAADNLDGRGRIRSADWAGDSAMAGPNHKTHHLRMPATLARRLPVFLLFKSGLNPTRIRRRRPGTTVIFPYGASSRRLLKPRTSSNGDVLLRSAQTIASPPQSTWTAPRAALTRVCRLNLAVRRAPLPVRERDWPIPRSLPHARQPRAGRATPRRLRAARSSPCSH